MIAFARTALLLAPLTLAACGSQPAAPAANEAAAIEQADNIVIPADEGPSPGVVNADTPEAAATARDLTGRWTGVEGMVLDVAAGTTPGTYRLTMQWDLDHKGSFPGTAEGDGIAFERDGKREMLRPSDGDATGLKYLAGKTDCLTVRSGEGYCR